MRLVALVAVPLALAGCFETLLCPSCQFDWLFEGEDPALYAAFARVNGSSITYNDWNGTADVLPLRAPTLDAAWGRSYLQTVAWEDPSSTQAQKYGVFVALPDPGSPNVFALRPADVPEAVIAARIDETLARVSDASPEARRATVAEALAHADLHEGTWYHSANLTGVAWRTQELWDEVGARARLNASDIGSGEAIAGEWRFIFSFPNREAYLMGEEAEGLVRANEHGAAQVRLRTHPPTKQEEARDAAEALLAAHGLAVNLTGWSVRPGWD